MCVIGFILGWGECIRVQDTRVSGEGSGVLLVHAGLDKEGGGIPLHQDGRGMYMYMHLLAKWKSTAVIRE